MSRRRGGICDMWSEMKKRRGAGAYVGKGYSLRDIQFTSDTPAVSINGVDVE